MLLDAIRRCRTSMIIVDDADRLKVGEKKDLEVTDHLRRSRNEAASPTTTSSARTWTGAAC